MSRGGVYFRLNRGTESLAEYERVISLARQWNGQAPPGKSIGMFEVDSQWMAAQICENLGNLQGARAHLEKVVEQSVVVNRNVALLRLVVVCLRLEDLPAARRAADRIQNDTLIIAEAFRLIREGELRLKRTKPGELLK